MGILIGIQPAVAQIHDRTIPQILDGIGVFAVPGQLRRHQHNTVSAVSGVEAVRLLKGHVLIGVAGLLGDAFVPLDAVAHIAQGGARLHGVTHRHQHHILLNIGEGLGDVRPACAVLAALRAQCVIPIEELALWDSLIRHQRQVVALAHDVGVVERWLQNLGVVELAAVGIVRRRMRVHDQAAGLLHGSDAGGGIDILGAAPRVFRGISPGLDQNAHAVVAAVHILPQRDIAADRPVPVHIESTAGIPRVDRSRIGVDGDAPLCLFDLEGGIILTQVDIDVGVAVSPVPVVTFVSKGDIALVFDVQVAGGVHRQRIAVACKGNIGDDVLVGDDIHRSIVQHTHAVADDGMVDTAVGIAFTGALDIPPGYLDLQLGVVLHGQDAGSDAIDSIALRAALAVIHVDVHGGAAEVERMVIISIGYDILKTRQP